MSVPVQTPYKKYTAAPGATVFPTTFRVVLAGDLQVRVNTVIVTSGFTLSALGAPSGLDVTFTAPMVGGEVVELQRIIPKSRVNDYQQLGDFNASTVNADIDRTWMSIQEVGEEISRAILVPIGSGIDPQDLIDQLVDSAATAVSAAAAADTDAATATAAAAAAAASAASTGLPALTGKALHLLRVKADESGYETRTPVQTLADIGAAPRATRIDVASVAGTVNLTTAAPDSDDIRLTGSLVMTGFTIAAGRVVRFVASGASTLTNNANIVTNTGGDVVLAAGVSGMLRATAANVVELVGLSRPSRYKSANQTWVGGGTLTLAHGLGVEPAIVTYKLKCLTAENGYSIGDVVQINPMWNRADSTPVGFTPRMDATNIVIAFNSTGTHALVPKTGGAIINTTFANWALIVEAFP